MLSFLSAALVAVPPVHADETSMDDRPTTPSLGDSSVPVERTEAFFQDEFAGLKTEQDSMTTPQLEKYLKGLRVAATSESLKSNAAWRANHGSEPPAPVQLKDPKIKLGIEVFLENPEYRKLVEGKKVGLITNPTGADTQFVSTIDRLAALPGVTLTALFAPEHGLRGAQGAGEKVVSGIDPVTGVPVYSLHGRDKENRPQNKPRPEMLTDVEVLVYDIQDIGNRSYTYISTMKLCMQAAKENNIPIIVLDRPNPMGGHLVSGNVLDPAYKTMVGTSAIAFLYGLTCGETALLFNEREPIGCDLTVVPMEGWKRSMRWWDTGIPWTMTSTHVQKAETCWYIAITGLIGELHVVNEGVGYPAPFEYIGAPWIDSQRLAAELNGRKLPGIYFRPAYYKPYYHTFRGEECGGVNLIITDYDTLEPVEVGIHIIEALHTLYPEQKILTSGADASTTKSRTRLAMFNKVMGGNTIRQGLLAGKSAAEVIEEYKPARDEFADMRRKYYLYKD